MARGIVWVMAGKGVANGLLNGLRLKKYWLPGGEGGAKIGWNTPGDYTRCVKLVGEETSDTGRFDVHGYCANLHHAATGKWPGDRANR